MDYKYQKQIAIPKYMTNIENRQMDTGNEYETTQGKLRPDIVLLSPRFAQILNIGHLPQITLVRLI